MLSLRRETMLVVWFRAATGSRNSFEGSVDVREIKEIRPGKLSRDFQKWSDDAQVKTKFFWGVEI